MSEHLEKAKGALDHAAEIVGMSNYGRDSPLGRCQIRSVNELLDIAAVQASMAQAEALESIAMSLECMARPLVSSMVGFVGAV